MTQANALMNLEVSDLKRQSYSIPTWWDDGPNTDGRHSYRYNCRQVVKMFVLGTLNKKLVAYETRHGHRHIYYTKKDGAELWLHKDNPSVKFKVCVAKKIGDNIIGNSSGLQAMRTRTGKMNFSGSVRQSIQSTMAEVMPMLPFRVFEEAKLDLDSVVVIDRGPEEYVQTDRVWMGDRGKVHFMGALLFKIFGEEEAHYLFDIDRNDIAEKRFNPFMSKLSRSASSIEDAYDSLKPEEVRQAEMFAKTKFPRQGEWFFIPVPGSYEPMPTPKGLRGVAELSSKGHRPHYASKMCKEGYVTGRITHGGHEHVPLDLDGWYRPVANQAEVSFKISGSID